jgi:hypothetical protein
MNWYSQLTQLIFSFYREDLALRRKIEMLEHCKVSRWWGTVRINCHDAKTAQDLLRAIDLIKEPIAELRLAHQIKLLVQGEVVTTVPIASSKLKA